MKYILISGNPVDGFEYIGPFDGPEAAHEYVENDRDMRDGDWWVHLLQEPAAQVYRKKGG